MILSGSPTYIKISGPFRYASQIAAYHGFFCKSTDIFHCLDRFDQDNIGLKFPDFYEFLNSVVPLVVSQGTNRNYPICFRRFCDT